MIKINKLQKKMLKCQIGETLAQLPKVQHLLKLANFTKIDRQPTFSKIAQLFRNGLKSIKIANMTKSNKLPKIAKKCQNPKRRTIAKNGKSHQNQHIVKINKNVKFCQELPKLEKQPKLVKTSKISNLCQNNQNYQKLKKMPAWPPNHFNHLNMFT